MKQWVKKIHYGDVLDILKKLPDECVDSIVTSPPYYGLRDYGVNGQVGLEKTLAEYLEKMLAITAELKRVLKPTGTMWWNHGDSYSTHQKGQKLSLEDTDSSKDYRRNGYGKGSGLPDKCLTLQAHRLAMRMIDEQGWILRNQIIWHKPNCMPSSVKDRFTVDYEPIFFFAKSKKYWFEMQYESHLSSEKEIARQHSEGKKVTAYATNKNWSGGVGYGTLGRNKRSVWKIATKPYKEAHFATFPPALIETPIKAGCPEFICNKCGEPREKVYEGASNQAFNIRVRDVKEGRIKHVDRRASGAEIKSYRENYGEGKKFFGYTNCGCKSGFEPGVVLDPFMGAGTTALVAEKLGRSWIGIELNQEYIEIAEKRLRQIGEAKKQQSFFPLQREILAL